MTRKILLPAQTIKTPAPSWKQELLTDSACQVYPRVSTPEQKKNVSTEMQQDKSFAIMCGWTDEKIIMDTDDLGLSGQLKMEERPAFVKMLRNIASGEVKTVIAAQVDRLFRDRWGAEYSKFMEICYTYGVKVVTPTASRTEIDFIYDFSIPWHIDKFRRKCEEAWGYLENHVYGRMLAAQRELGEHGCWAGSGLPLGYIVDRREKVDGKKNPSYRKFMIYEPHAEVVRWLFARFCELAGQIKQLLREIERIPVLFPACEGVDDEIVAAYSNKKVYDDGDEEKTLLGYTIASEGGLRGLLSNPAYVGYWVYNHVVVSTDNHDAIVDYGTFIYAYNRLSAWHLDGRPNEAYLEKRKRYVKKYKANRPGLLKNHLEASDPAYAIHPSEVPRVGKKTKGTVEVLYGFYRRKTNVEGSNYLLRASDVDRFFLQRFIERLQQANGFEHFLDLESAEQQAQVQLQQDIARDIKAAEAHMSRINKQVESGMLTNPELLKNANTTYTKLQEDVARLRTRLHEVTTDKSQCQQRRTYRQMMQEAGERWDEVVDFETLLLMIDLFVQKVVITPLTPRFYTISIHWLDPDWGIDEALCWRGGNPSLYWSNAEEEVLKQHYPHASRAELLQILPTRSYKAMVYHARELGVIRQVVETIEVPKNVSWNDFQQGLTREEIRQRKQAPTPHWTKEEDALLRLFYPSAPRIDLLQAIPARHYESMCHRAQEIGLRRQRSHELGTLPRNTCWLDYQLMLEHDLTEEFLFGREGSKPQEGGRLIIWASQPHQTLTFFDITPIIALLHKILKR